MPSSKPVFQKLGLKPNFKAAKLNVPKGLSEMLDGVPKGFKFDDSFGRELDFILGFYESSKEVKADAPKIKKALKKSGMAWLCWKKGNVTDLSRDTLARLVETHGLEGVSSCAINDEWSALKFMYPKEQREIRK